MFWKGQVIFLQRAFYASKEQRAKELAYAILSQNRFFGFTCFLDVTLSAMKSKKDPVFGGAAKLNTWRGSEVEFPRKETQGVRATGVQ